MKNAKVTIKNIEDDIKSKQNNNTKVQSQIDKQSESLNNMKNKLDSVEDII